MLRGASRWASKWVELNAGGHFQCTGVHPPLLWHDRLVLSIGRIACQQSTAACACSPPSALWTAFGGHRVDLPEPRHTAGPCGRVTAGEGPARDGADKGMGRPLRTRPPVHTGTCAFVAITCGNALLQSVAAGRVQYRGELGGGVALVLHREALQRKACVHPLDLATTASHSQGTAEQT